MKDLPKITVFIDGKAQELKRKEEGPSMNKSMVRVHWTEEDKAIATKQEEQKLPSNARTVTDLKKDQETYDQLKIQQGELYRKKCKVCNYLVDLPEATPQEEAKALVDQIMAIKEVYNINAGYISYYDKNGSFPEAPQEEKKPKLSEMDKSELMQRLTNIRSNISKAKNNIKKHQRKPAQLVKYEQKLARLEAEKCEIEERLIKG